MVNGPREVPGTATLPQIDTGRPLCRVLTCVNAVYCREMCKKHYQRYLRHGNPYVVKPAGRPRKVVENAA